MLRPLWRKGMLFKPTCKIGAFVMLLLIGIMLLPLTVSCGAWRKAASYSDSALYCVLIAALLLAAGHGPCRHIHPRALFMATASSWLRLSVTGTLPFLFAG